MLFGRDSRLILRRRLALLVASLVLNKEAKQRLFTQIQLESGEFQAWRASALTPALKYLKAQGKSETVLKKLRKPLARIQELERELRAD